MDTLTIRACCLVYRVRSSSLKGIMKKSTLVVVPVLLGMVALSTLLARTEPAAQEFGRYTATPNIVNGGVYVTDHATNTMYLYSNTMDLQASIDLSQAGNPKLEYVTPTPPKKPE